MTICFNVPAVPVPQPRQRHTIIGEGEHAYVHNYTPTKDPVNAFKATVRHVLRNSYNGPPLEGPLKLSLVFVMPRPKRLVWKRKPMPRCWYEGRCDRENLQKSVMDAITKLAWRDDRQVVSGPCDVVYAAGDEQPHVEIRIAPLSLGPEPL